MTQLAFADRVQETAQNLGSATVVALLGVAAGNLRTFAEAGLDGKTVPYAIEHRTSAQWEVGYGVYTLGGATLMRAVVLCNSDGTTSLVNFSSGIVDVWNDLPAEKVVAMDADSNHVTLPGGITVNGPIVATGPITAPGGITGPVAWTSITGTPTTIAGYGISDAYTKTASDARFAPIAVPWLTITGTPTTLAGYGITDAYTKAASDARFAATGGPFAWGAITGTPTTLAGYGILDAYTKAQADARFAPTPTPWGTITGTPTTLAGYGITDAYTKTAADALFAFKAGPFAWSAVTGTPTTLAGYGITDAFTKTESDARYVQTSGGPFVASVTGTAGRISITGTATAPIVNIDPAYIGQASITTVGTIIAGVWNGVAIAATSGGTGQVTYAAGDTLYASAVNTLSKLAVGTANQFLRVAIGVPAWHTLVAADITDFATAVTGITKVGTITVGVWNGTPIAPTFGGTGLTAYATGDLLYASAPNVLATRTIGGANQILTVVAGLPAWHTLVTADITDLTTAATGITKVGTITTGVWAGTPIAPTAGGTGLTAYGPGDLIVGSGINTLARLAGPTALTRTFLMSAGTGVVANPPVWTTLTAADVGPGTFTGAFTFTGPLTMPAITGPTTITGNLTVTGTSNLQGAVTLNTTLAVAGGTTGAGATFTALSILAPGSVGVTIDTPATSTSALIYNAGGVPKWQLGRRIVDGTEDYIIYNQNLALPAIRFASLTNVVTISGPVTVFNTITSGANGLLFSRAGASTLYQYFAISNTGGDMLLGVEGSTTAIMSGVVPYDVVLRAGAGMGLSFGNTTTGTTMRLGSSGVAAFSVGINLTGVASIGTPGSIYTSAASGLIIFGAAGSGNDLVLANRAGSTIMEVPAATYNALFRGSVTVVGQVSAASFISIGANYTSIKSPNGQDGVLIGAASVEDTIYFQSAQINFRNRAANQLYASITDATLAGETSLFLKVVDLASVVRVRTGPAASGPGGVGRALYVT